MNTRRRSLSVTPKRNTPAKNASNSFEENDENAGVSSSKRVEELINGMRITACRTITNVKSSIGGLSYKLRQSTRKNCKLPKSRNYEELDEQVTPVKLYAPFTFVTPSPSPVGKKVTPKCKRLSSKRFDFASPTGKFQKDVKQLSQGVKELERVEKSLALRKFR